MSNTNKNNVFIPSSWEEIPEENKYFWDNIDSIVKNNNIVRNYGKNLAKSYLDNINEKIESYKDKFSDVDIRNFDLYNKDADIYLKERKVKEILEFIAIKETSKKTGLEEKHFDKIEICDNIIEYKNKHTNFDCNDVYINQEIERGFILSSLSVGFSLYSMVNSYEFSKSKMSVINENLFDYFDLNSFYVLCSFWSCDMMKVSSSGKALKFADYKIDKDSISARGMSYPLLIASMIEGSCELASLNQFSYIENSIKNTLFNKIQYDKFTYYPLMAQMGIPLWEKVIHSDIIEKMSKFKFIKELSKMSYEDFNNTIEGIINNAV